MVAAALSALSILLSMHVNSNIERRISPLSDVVWVNNDAPINSMQRGIREDIIVFHMADGVYYSNWLYCGSIIKQFIFYQNRAFNLPPTGLDRNWVEISIVRRVIAWAFQGRVHRDSDRRISGHWDYCPPHIEIFGVSLPNKHQPPVGRTAQDRDAVAMTYLKTELARGPVEAAAVVDSPSLDDPRWKKGAKPLAPLTIRPLSFCNDDRKKKTDETASASRKVMSGEVFK